MARIGTIALVLHAHLPYPAGGLAADPLARRWVLEALWECYLPLLDVLDRLATEQRPGALTLSVAPPLASMLRAAEIGPLLEQHLDRLRRANQHEMTRAGSDLRRRDAAEHYDARLDQAQRTWRAIDGDLLAALRAHHAQGRIDLMTTSASHGYLPGLQHRPQAVRAQLRLGRRSFRKLSGHTPTGLWLPECGFVPMVGRELAGSGYGYTVLDGHGLTRGQPRPPRGASRPVVDRFGVAYFGRDSAASHQVWSRAHGYPGDPAYRDFYRDLGFERPDDELDGLGAGAMTGLKYHRITGRTEHKEPYEPGVAAERVAQHAAHFVDSCRHRVSQSASDGGPPPVLVAAYDAELFGHWWFEGPSFVEQVLRHLAVSEELEAVSLRDVLEQHPHCPVVQPASSSWGQGGHGEVWLGPEAAHLWRHVHRAHDEVTHAVRAVPHAEGSAGRALDQAIRELMLLEASDWAFMIHGGDLADYAHQRVARHDQRILELVGLAQRAEPTAQETARVDELCDAGGYLQELSGQELRDVFG